MRTVHTNEPEGVYRATIPELDVGELLQHQGNNKETQTQSPDSEERMYGIGRETQVQQPSKPAGEEDTNRSTQPHDQPSGSAGTNSATPTHPLQRKRANHNLPWQAVNASGQQRNVRLSDSLPGTMEEQGKQVVSAKSATLPNRSSQVRNEGDDEVMNEQPKQTKRESQVSEGRDKEPEDTNRFNEPEQATSTKCSSQVKDDQVEDIDVGRSNEQSEQATVSKQDSQDRDDEVPEDMERFNVQPKQATLDNQVPEDTERYETPEQATVNKQGSQDEEERNDRVQDDVKRFSQQLELPTLTPLDEMPSSAPPVQSPTITSTNQETGSPRSSIAQGEIFESLQRVRIRHDSVQESMKATPKETAV